MNAGNEREVRRLIEAILKRGYKVNVFDGEETTVRQSTDREKIFAALDTAESDVLTMYNEGQRLGWFELIYCNAEDGSEVIHNHAMSEACFEIYKELYPY